MSINVTVHGNPVSIRRGKMISSDIGNTRKFEIDRRRKIRLQQVRQQSKEVASQLRNRVAAEKQKKLTELETKKAEELNKWKTEKLAQLQNEYQDCLEEIGVGHAGALEEPDANQVLEERKRLNDNAADKRGREAARKQKQTGIENERRVASRYKRPGVDMIKTKTSRTSSNISKRSMVNKEVLINNIVSDEESYVSDNLDGNNCSSNSDIPPLLGLDSSEDRSLNDNSQKIRISDATNSKNTCIDDHESNKNERNFDYELFREKYSTSRRLPNSKNSNEREIKKRGDSNSFNSLPEKSFIIDMTNIDHLSLINKNANANTNVASIPSQDKEKFLQSNVRPIFTDITEKIKSRSYRNRELSKDNHIGGCEDIASTNLNKTKFQENFNGKQNITKPLDSIGRCASKVKKDTYHTISFTNDDSDIIDMQIEPPINQITEEVINRIKSTKTQLENIQPELENLKRDLQSLETGSTKRTNKHDKDVISRSETKNTFSKSVKSGKSKSVTSEKKSKVLFYDHNTRYEKEYKTPQNLVERSISKDDLSAHDLAQYERETVSQKLLDESKQHGKNDDVSQSRGRIALQKEKLRKNYGTLLENLEQLSNQERITRTSAECPRVDAASNNESDLTMAFEKILNQVAQNELTNNVITLPLVNNKFKTKVSIQKKKESSPPTLNVATWEVPKNGLQNEKYTDLDKSPSRDLSGQSSSSSIVVGHLPPIVSDSVINKIENNISIEIQSKIELNAVKNLLDRLNLQKHLLLQELEHTSWPENSKLNEVLKSVEESFKGNSENSKVVSSSKSEGRHYKNGPKIEREKNKLEERERNLLKKELKLERKLKRLNKDNKNDILETNTEELKEKQIIEIKSKLPNKMHKAVQVNDATDGKPEHQSSEPYAFNKSTKPDFREIHSESAGDSNLNSSNGSFRDSTTSTDLSSSGVEITIKIKNKLNNASPRKFSVLTKGPSVIQKSKKKKTDTKIKQDKIHMLHEESNIKHYRKTDSAESGSTIYMSPPSEIAQMGNLIDKVSGNNETGAILDYVEINQSYKQISIGTEDESHSKQSIIIREDVNKKSKSEEIERERDPLLVNYIKKLLTMSRESVDALGISTGSDLSTPGESVIDISSNIQDIRNEFFEYPDIEKKKKFIAESYSFIEEIESTLKTDTLCECPENTFDDTLLPKDTDLNKLNKKQKKSIQTNLHVSSSSSTLSDNVSVNKVGSDKLTCNKKSSQFESPGSSLKHSTLNSRKIKYDVSAESDKSLDISVVPHSERVSDNITWTDITHDDFNTNINRQRKSKQIDLHKYTELTESCSQRIQSIADELSKVRQAKQKLLESSDSSSTSTGQNSTEYMDLPNNLHVTTNSDLQGTNRDNINNLHKRNEDDVTDVPLTINNDEEIVVPFIPMLKDIPKQRVHGVSLIKPALHINNNLQETSGKFEMTNPHLERKILDLRENVSHLSSKLDGFESDIGKLQSTLYLGNEYKHQKVNTNIKRPPVALSRNAIRNNLDIDQGKSHELSTILEVDTPTTSKLLESDFENSVDINNSKMGSPLKEHSISLNEDKIPQNVEKNIEKEQKDFKFVTYDDGNIKIIHNGEGSFQLSRNLFSLNDSNLRITLRSPDKEYVDSKSSTSVIDDEFNKSAPQFQFKPYLTYEEYRKTVQQNRKEYIDSCDKELSISGENSDDTMPDVVAELLRRNVLQEPFDNATLSDFSSLKINSEDSKEHSNRSVRDVQPITKDAEIKHRSTTTKQKYTVDAFIKLSTKTKNEPGMSGIHFLSDTTDKTSSSISPDDMENTLNKLGLGWAVSTLKKTQEAMALSSSSSFDSPSNEIVKGTGLGNAAISVGTGCNKNSLYSEESDKMKRRAEMFNNDSDEYQEKVPKMKINESSDSFESGNLNIKEFLMKEFKFPNMNSNSLENSQKEYIFKSLLSGSQDLIMTDHTINRSIKNQCNKRTSTPVQVPGTSSNSYAEKTNTSDGLFSGESHLSSVRNISTENHYSVDESETLSVPQVSLNIDRTLRKHKKT